MSNNMPASHAGRTIFITGASSGVGAHAAKLLAAAGARIVAGARRADRLAGLVGEIAAAGGTAIAVPVDVEDADSIRAAYAMAEERLGPIDTVIANAGVNTEGPALTLEDDAFDQIMRVNVRGAFHTAREGAQRMIAAGVTEGRIVFIASIGGTKVQPGLAAYCSSKAAVVMMSRALAVEWARYGISVNTICPGFMLTEITQDWFGTPAGDRMIERFPRRRLMPLEALDPSLLYLTSSGGGHTTGATVVVDDGQSI
ncbi:SDR family NAD(P)-dependent oxidoreductase [Sphingobium sp. EM0848]|uniref:SDR family NAD(P)-dependent oxidoreductase n=1 Tax=Sphingobium sp. EM0848 TaxID=2743473 RepID=UPI0021014438|nr:SDR family NAD(P)-dependent oxidoreductase [Sphingobium sp. EM0848]